MQETVIQTQASELYKVTVVAASQTLSADQTASLTTALATVNAQIVAVSQQITVVQTMLVALTGKTLTLTTLEVILAKT